ncbi:DUF3817 domain-containing protein [Pontibacter sp. KCTC 32443]|uniref:DUF3817 domain-containing protein n=1 Tax=Pontibacter TaxID=323449 RepID=UPI00164E3DB7|nr:MULTISPECIES: DUF3817 domain-containing protein [Pontibacter]MBC5772442.1 DUF3817 domain-containing protein [Pontibacter sp. KCTC 32443]
MSTPLSRFRAVALYEGISFLVLLLIAMPLKYMFGIPELVKYVGWAHGVLFVLYVATLAHVFFAERWSILKAIVAFALSFVPFGTFWLDKKLKEEEQAKLAQKREKQAA